MVRLLWIGALAALLLPCRFVQADDDKKEDAKADGPAREHSLFDSLDKNTDGKLNADEVPQDKRGLFDRLLRNADKDKDGNLSKDEFAQGMQERRGRGPGAEGTREGRGNRRPDPERMFSRLDKNSDGKLTKDEAPEERPERFEHMLKNADKDKDGAVSKDEMKAHFEERRKQAGGPGGPGGGRGGERWFEERDKNKDGKVTSDEIPEERRERFGRMLENLDKNADKAISKEEF